VHLNNNINEEEASSLEAVWVVVDARYA